MYNILLTGAFKYSDEQMQAIEGLGFNVYFLRQESDELPLHAKDIDVTVCNGLFLHHDIEKFNNLKYIQLTSAGLERVPIDKIKERNITLHNARGVYSIPMAEWAVFRVLEYYKQANHFRNAQQTGVWEKNRLLKEIFGVKIAIVGAGNVGQEVAKRFSAFGAHIVGFDVHRNATPYFEEVNLVNHLSERIDNFDVVVLTAPLTPQTRHLISGDLISKMKHNTLLVNIARGGLIEESALCGILRERSDIHAALDVFETEPLPLESPLWKLPNVSVSPHNSFVSDGNSERMFNVIYNNLKSFISVR